MAKKEKKSPSEMSFIDHLEELRWLLVRSTLAIIVCGSIAFAFSSFIFDEIIFAPINGDFVTYRFFCDLANTYGLDKSFCMEKLPFEIQSRTMDGQFSTDIWTSIAAGFILGFPIILWEFWKFIRPALYDTERKYAVAFLFSTSVLFFSGILFGYYIITPLSLNFLGNYQISSVVKNDIDLQSYLSIIKTTAISCGLIFELPIIMYFLSKVGLVSAATMKSTRRYAYVIMLLVAAVVTPPDVVSQIIVTIPLMLLYELSIIIATRMEKRANKQ
ncbi:twin-arginine translocase subunit TatC [Flavobacterium arcticum]|nr:twin-arginine translocase subunit TatC [Flavobacterium arcticum]